MKHAEHVDSVQQAQSFCVMPLYSGHGAAKWSNLIDSKLNGSPMNSSCRPALLLTVLCCAVLNDGECILVFLLLLPICNLKLGWEGQE